MSKGRKLTQQQKDHLKGLANQQQRWKMGKLKIGGFDKGILTPIPQGQSIQVFESGWTYGVDGVEGSVFGKETMEELLRKINGDTIKSEPKDERTESEKWADDWARKNSKSTGQRAVPSNTNPND